MGPPITLPNSIWTAMLIKYKHVLEHGPKLWFLRRGHVRAPLAGGWWTPAPPFYNVVYRVISLTDINGCSVRCGHVYVAIGRQTLKKPQKFDKFPPHPLNNPCSSPNSNIFLCSPWLPLQRDVRYFHIWQGVVEKYPFPQAHRFCWKWGVIFGGCCPATPQGRPACDTG